MGANLNWLAVQGVDKVDLLERLGFVEAGLSSDELNVPVACAVLPKSWVVIASWGKGLDLDRLLPRASAGTLALGGEMDDRVMFSQLGAFQDGAPAWAVTHDPDRGLDNVTVQGEPPGLLAQVRAELVAEQAGDGFEDVDYMFEAPVRLSERLCGYHPEAPLPVEWKILEPAGGRRRPSPDLRLADAFRSELLPQLEGSGWTLAARDAEFRGRAWDVTRVLDGRRQWLSFTWREDCVGPAFETSFLVFSGQAWDSPHLMVGAVRQMRAAAPRQGGAFWRRLLGRADDVSRPRPEDRMVEFVGPIREDLAALDRFLVSGEPDARIEVRFGSAESLRSARA
ncbi:MAG TPA: hypothetical protein VJS38_04280 [Phenylobacterium sp.]|uniref:hypothetical protein n=1 Tax=Phenylobacterium sp. TaxID=1871053 RepID=UPI002B47078C|nr:hypothetical protein [Phenylobacterium sp.]HKR87369.1 hypothetical protein [Phenylobacterium sp.]